jgi:2-keto-4-pentenoate hydratase
MVASNVGSDRYIIGQKIPPSEIDVNGMPIVLTLEGEILHETNGSVANGGQWRNFRLIMNNIRGQGHTIRAGSIIISGALG